MADISTTSSKTPCFILETSGFLVESTCGFLA